MRISAAILLLLSLGVWAEVGGAAEVGDVAPEFACLDDQGQQWNSRDHVGKSPLVIYFYLSDFSFCCTRQANRYRDAHDELAKQSAEVIGISGDAVQSHRWFKAAKGLDFTLLSDPDGSIARKFGVPLRAGGKAMAVDTNGQAVAIPRLFTAARWTFVIGADGRIVHRDTGASPVKDAQVVLDFLRKVNPE